jgi:hypothetical protein
MSDYNFDYTRYSTAGSEWIPSDGCRKSAAQAFTWAFDDGLQQYSSLRQAWTEEFTVAGNIHGMDLPDISHDGRFPQQKEPMYTSTLDPASFSETHWVPGSPLDYRSERQSGFAVPFNDTGISTSSWPINMFGGIASPFATGGSSSMMPAQSSQCWTHFLPQAPWSLDASVMSAKHMPMESSTGTTQHCADSASTVSAGTLQSSEDVPDTIQLCATSAFAGLQRSKVIEMCRTNRSIFRHGQRCEKCQEARYSDPANYQCGDQVHNLCHSTILELVVEKLTSANWSEAGWKDDQGKMEEFHIWLFIFGIADLPEEISANRQAHKQRMKHRRNRRAMRSACTEYAAERNRSLRGYDDIQVTDALDPDNSVLDTSVASTITHLSLVKELKSLIFWLKAQDISSLEKCYDSKEEYVCKSCLNKTWDPPGSCKDLDHRDHYDAAAAVVRKHLKDVDGWNKVPKKVSAYQIWHWFHGIPCPQEQHYGLQTAYQKKSRSLRRKNKHEKKGNRKNRH